MDCFDRIDCARISFVSCTFSSVPSSSFVFMLVRKVYACSRFGLVSV